jgi:hypothetical protein
VSVMTGYPQTEDRMVPLESSTEVEFWEETGNLASQASCTVPRGFSEN